MNNKGALRTQLNEIGWLAVIYAVVGATVALRYMTGLPGTQWWQYLYVFGAAAGVFFIGHFLLQLLLVLPLSRLSSCGGIWTHLHPFGVACHGHICLPTVSLPHQLGDDRSGICRRTRGVFFFHRHDPKDCLLGWLFSWVVIDIILVDHKVEN